MIDRIAIVAALAAATFTLAACGKSEDRIRQEERARVEAEFAAKQQSAAMPAAVQSSAAPVPAKAAAAAAAAAERPTWAGNYDLVGDGSEGDVKISPIAGSPAKYSVSIAIAGAGGSGCVGGIAGTAIEVASRHTHLLCRSIGIYPRGRRGCVHDRTDPAGKWPDYRCLGRLRPMQELAWRRVRLQRGHVAEIAGFLESTGPVPPGPTTPRHSPCSPRVQPQADYPRSAAARSRYCPACG